MLCAALFKRNISLYLFRVGLCSHTVLTLQVTWRHDERRIEVGTLDRVDRSPRDQHQNTCLKKSLSSTLDARHVAERGAPIVIGRLQLFAIGGTSRSSDFHRTAAIVRDLFDACGAIMIGGSSSDGRDLARWEHRGSRSNLHPTAKMKTSFLSLRGNLERRIPIRRRRRRVEEHHDRGPIEPRSRRD